VNLVKWLISIAIMLRIVGLTHFLFGSGRRSIVAAKIGPSLSVAPIHCWRSSWACERKNKCGDVITPHIGITMNS